MPNGTSKEPKWKRETQKHWLRSMNGLLDRAEKKKKAAEKADEKGNILKRELNRNGAIKDLLWAHVDKSLFMSALPDIYGTPFLWWHFALYDLNELVAQARDELRKNPPNYDEANKKIQKAREKKAEIEKKLPQ